MGNLEEEFATLAADVRALVGLLQEAEETFWSNTLSRGLRQIESNKLAGATYILGCYGGVDTFSDLVIGRQWSRSDPLRYRNLNARLGHLRTRTFESANAIAARRSW
ncbi:MAG: hypothetical protein AB7I04_22660 [Pseudomonadales bacterium]